MRRFLLPHKFKSKIILSFNSKFSKMQSNSELFYSIGTSIPMSVVQPLANICRFFAHNSSILANLIKLFNKLNCTFEYCSCVLDIDRHFHPSLIFVVKVGILPSLPQVHPCCTLKYQVRMCRSR